MWGEYHAPIANREAPNPSAVRRRSLAVGEQDRAGRDIRDPELRKGPRADEPSSAESHDRPVLARAARLERSHDHDAHGEKGEAVATRLPGDVE